MKPEIRKRQRSVKGEVYFSSLKKQKLAKRKPKREKRNWLDLPRDVAIHIFLNLGVFDIILNVQSVCSSWRKLAKEPQLFRCIEMENVFYPSRPSDSENLNIMAKDCIDRSCGQLVKFSVTDFATDDLLHYLANKSISLKCLRLSYCFDFTEDGLTEVVKKFHALEELELCHCNVMKKVIEVAGSSCPQLTTFGLIQYGLMLPPSKVTDKCNEEAFVIAANMPQLRRLHVFGNLMNDDGLQVILEKCPHLEYLDLRQCFNIKFEGDLRNKCKGVQNIRFPNDSTDDCKFDTTIEYAGESDDDHSSNHEDSDDMYGDDLPGGPGYGFSDGDGGYEDDGWGDFEQDEYVCENYDEDGGSDGSEIDYFPF
ncbi:hypothetical protein ACHQM5_010543 [Ranunculus cassubicifolius]